MNETKYNDSEIKRLEKLRVQALKSTPQIDTKDLFDNLNIPQRREYAGADNPTAPLCKKEKNPFYQSINADYGYFPIPSNTCPAVHFPKSSKFTSFLAKHGMYRNYSLNTQMDKSFY